MTSPLFTHVHIAAFLDPHVFTTEIELFQSAAQALGYTTSIEHHTIKADALNILFAAHNEPLSTFAEKAEHIIIYNLEQIGPDVPWLQPQFLEVLNHFYAWDYNQQNRQLLLNNGAKHIDFVPMGYMPFMTRPLEIEQDIDVLFFGTMNARRQELLDAIQAKGLNLVSNATLGRPILGEELDQLIARSKVVLNAHFYQDTHVFEIARVSRLLANGKAVVTEVSDHTAIEPDLLNAVSSGTIDQLPDLVEHLVQNDDEREALAARGKAIFTARDERQILAQAIDRYTRWYLEHKGNTSFAHQQASTTLIKQPAPKQLSYCHDVPWNMFWVNMSRHNRQQPDVLLDAQSWLWPLDQSLPSQRFDDFVIASESIEHIRASNIAQTVPDLHAWLVHLLKTLKVGGDINIYTPYSLSQWAWGHVDTKRQFNEPTWNKILDAIKQEHLEWGYFEKTSCVHSMLNENSYGYRKAPEYNNDLQTILHIPHIVDGISVVLTKRSHSH